MMEVASSRVHELAQEPKRPASPIQDSMSYLPFSSLMAALEGELKVPVPTKEEPPSSPKIKRSSSPAPRDSPRPKVKPIEIQSVHPVEQKKEDEEFGWDEHFEENSMEIDGDDYNELDSEDSQSEEEDNDGKGRDWKGSKPPGEKKKNPKKVKSSSNSNSMKKRSHPHVLGKNKFKDASVQVLLDQRKKGVKALSPKEIWFFIQKQDLIDTKGKTPQSSLCAALSLDVKKGNDSVFVKVGTGMYALRDDPNHTNAELQQYLNSVRGYYKKYRKSESESDEEKKSNESGSGNEAKRPNRQSSPKLRSEVEQPKVVEGESNVPRWMGDCIGTKNNRKHYAAVQYNHQSYRIGDCVYFNPPDGSQQAYLGRITALYQPCGKDSLDDMMIECIYYFYPEETHCGRQTKHHKREVFLSPCRDRKQVNTLRSIKPQVLSMEEFKEKQQNAESLEDIYFCNSFYDSSETLDFRSLEAAEDPYFNLSSSLNESILSSKEVLSQLRSHIRVLNAELLLRKMELETANNQLEDYRIQITSLSPKEEISSDGSCKQSL